MLSTYKTPRYGRTPTGTPRSPRGVLKTSQASLALIFCLELIAIAALMLRSPDGNPLTVGTRGRRLLADNIAAKVGRFQVPIVPEVAPEYAYFTIDTCTRLVCQDTLVVTHSTTFISALQLCLGTPRCGGVLYDPMWKTTTLCQNVVTDTKSSSIKTNMLLGGGAQCQLSGQRKRQKPSHPCPGLNNQCLVLESLELQSGFNDQAQQLTQRDGFKALWDGPPMHFRAYNPGLVEYRGDWFAAIRLSNWTYCPWESSPMTRIRKKPEQGVYSTTALCQLQMPVASIKVDTCTFLPPMDEDPLVLSENATQSWNVPHAIGRGIEDIRPFVHDNKLRLSGNRRHLIDGTTLSPLDIQQFRLRGKEASIVVDIEMDDDLSDLTRDVHGIECEVEAESLLQKNWMPLSATDGLFYVTRLQPLTIVKVEIGEKANTCKLAYQESGLMPSYEARTFKAGLRGGSSFIQLDNSTYFGLAHSRQGALTYHHHFLILERFSEDRFELTWVSEAFRLPRSPDLSPVGTRRGVQFSMSVAKYDDDLLVSYGDGDCDANIAVEPGFFGKLNDYMRFGLATHKLSWAVSNQIHEW